HPLRVELTLDRADYAFGDVADAKFAMINLGARSLTLRARHRTWIDALLLRPGESASLDLVVDEVDADGLGSLQKRRRTIPVELNADLKIGSGAMAVIAARVEVEEAPGALFR